MSLPPTAEDIQLNEAASNGNHDAVVELLELGASPNAAHDPDAGTSLHAAAKHGHVQVVKQLVRQGAQLAARTTDGSTALHLAAHHGHKEVAAALVAAGASVNAQDKKGNTALHAAAMQGNMEIMDLLLGAGANLNAPDSEKLTPLHQACISGKHMAASQLLAHAAAVAATCVEGLQPLHCAAGAGHLEVVAVLLRSKASVTALTHAGRTPLYLAAAAGHQQVTQLLLSSGADPYTPDADGWLPLHMACVCNHVGVVTRLLLGRQIPEHVSAPGPQGVTPLHLASSTGHAEVVSMLSKAGANVDALSANQRTSLHQAVINGHSAVVAQLLAAGADAAAVTQTGALSLHVAAMRGYATILQQLLAAMAARQDGGGGVDALWEGKTASHMALEQGHTDCLHMLIAAGADPSKLYGAAARDSGGNCIANWSPLHKAVLLHRAAALPLLATPANMAHVHAGCTPLHWALQLPAPSPVIVGTLVAAGSLAGVANAAGSTAMSLAADSHAAAIRGLLTAMVRGECERYKQLQQGVGGQQQQQQQEPSVLFAAVAEALYVHLKASAPYTSLERPTQALACFKVVMEVLGPAAGGDLLQQVLCKVAATRATAAAAAAAVVEAGGAAVAAVGGVDGTAGAAADKAVPLLLYRVLHTAWLEVVQPLLKQRSRLTNRMQLVANRLVQQQKQQKQGRQRQREVWGSKALSCGAWASDACAELKTQAVAAAGSGQWGLFVQLLDHLTGLRKASASLVLRQVEQQQEAVGAPDVMGLCGELLAAWQAAVVGLAGRMQQELADAVVGAVAAAGQLRRTRTPQP